MKRSPLKRKPLRRKRVPKAQTKPKVHRAAKPKTQTYWKHRADKAFSDFIRSRDSRCVRCGRTPVECAHIITRAVVVLRCDPDNALGLCAVCHRLGRHSWHSDPVAWARWLEATYPGRYDSLIQKEQEARESMVKINWEEVYHKTKNL